MKFIADLLSLIQKSTDDALRQFLTSLPVSWQHFLRDKGMIKLLSDFAAITMMPALVITSPKVALNTIKYWWTSSSHVIGFNGKALPALECHDLRSMKSSERCDEENNLKRKLFRVLLFVHGGAWGSGQLWQYRDIAIQYGLLLNADVTTLIKYSYYPDASITDQRDALLRAIHYIHGPEFQRKCGLSQTDANRSNVELVVCGHSSGAHLSILSSVEMLKTEVDSVELMKVLGGRPAIHSIIGLSGPYDLVKHFDFESGRGVQHISPMLGAAGGNIEGLARCSPDVLLFTGYVQQGENDESQSSSRSTKIHLLHGTDDGTVPHAATERMETALIQAGYKFVKGHYYPVSFIVESLSTCVSSNSVLTCSPGSSSAALIRRYLEQAK